MSLNVGVWFYRTPYRQGHIRLVLGVNESTGRISAQRQKFNNEATSQPLTESDVFSGEGMDAALAWLRNRHSRLLADGYHLGARVGLASQLTLASEEVSAC